MKLPEIKIQKILYTTDLSDTARHAFAYAVSLANLYHAGITILHVLPDIPDMIDSQIAGYVGGDEWERIRDAHMESARQALIGKRRDNAAIREVLDRFCNSIQSEECNPEFIKDEVIIKRGEPVEQILATANEQGCDLIVMGTRGLGTLADAMIGGTARRVLRRSAIPVLTVQNPE